MYTKFSLSVIVPVFNEIELLEKSIDLINDFLRKNFTNYEIIIIESGSTDGSAQTCDTLALHNPCIKIIHEGSRKGFGSALKLGYLSANKDLVWLVTVDRPFPLEAILAALVHLEKHDCVLSYRSKDPRKVSRRIQSYIYNLLVKRMLRLRQRHVNSAFKVFKKDVIKKMPLISNGWLIDAEILYRLQKSKISCAEIPVELYERPNQKSSIGVTTFISVLKELARFMKYKDSVAPK